MVAARAEVEDWTRTLGTTPSAEVNAENADLERRRPKRWLAQLAMRCLQTSHSDCLKKRASGMEALFFCVNEVLL